MVIHDVLRFLKDSFTNAFGQRKWTMMYGYRSISLMFIQVHQLLINGKKKV